MYEPTDGEAIDIDMRVHVPANEWVTAKVTTMKIQTRQEFHEYEGQPGPPTEVWLVDDGDVWLIYCMDCGTRIGTVNTGNEHGAATLTKRHNDTLHRTRF